jgi:hypothetical protein
MARGRVIQLSQLVTKRVSASRRHAAILNAHLLGRQVLSLPVTAIKAPVSAASCARRQRSDSDTLG